MAFNPFFQAGIRAHHCLRAEGFSAGDALERLVHLGAFALGRGVGLFESFGPQDFQRFRAFVSTFTGGLPPLSSISEGDRSILESFIDCCTDDSSPVSPGLAWFFQGGIQAVKDGVQAYATPQDARDLSTVTQLFTPTWLSDFLVDSALDSCFAGSPPGEESLRNVRVLDPACGGGNLLLSASRALFHLYRQAGVAHEDALRHILNKNLVGLDIDPLACVVTKFSLLALAQELHPGIVGDVEDLAASQRLLPQIYALQKRKDPDPYVSNLDIIGSLLPVENLPGKLVDATPELSVLMPGRYDIVLANPPYLGHKNFPPVLRDFAHECYPQQRTDLYAMFIRRCLDWAKPGGQLGLLTMQSWMFLPSYRNLRETLWEKTTVRALAHIQSHGFDHIKTPLVQTVAWVSTKDGEHGKPALPEDGWFFDLREEKGEAAKAKALEELRHLKNLDPQATSIPLGSSSAYRRSSRSFSSFPQALPLYWTKPSLRRALSAGLPLSSIAEVRQGLATGDNKRFVRYWWQVPPGDIARDCRSRKDAVASGKTWFPYNKGGVARRWWGNQDLVVNWDQDGADIRAGRTKAGRVKARVQNVDYYFRPSISWSKVGTALAFRYYPSGFIFDVAGTSIFLPEDAQPWTVLGYANSSVVSSLLHDIAPTMNFEVGQVASLPWLDVDPEIIVPIVQELVDLAKYDYISRESALGFAVHPLCDYGPGVLMEHMVHYRDYCLENLRRYTHVEADNNRYFAQLFGLSGDVPLDVSHKHLHNPAQLLNNPQGFYRRLAQEIISYALSCSLGFYSWPDEDSRPQTQTIALRANAVAPGAKNTRAKDVLRDFISATWGEENALENEGYLALCLNPESQNTDRVLDDYLEQEYYTHHIQLYLGEPRVTVEDSIVRARTYEERS
ncbi:MAG: N-6 DNA methylase [Actinomycetaceae bacterium]|nr:N-6 DNA methylase [Actinomycetaceae bacterium]